MEATFQDQSIRGSTAGVSPTHSGPGKPAGLPDQVLCSPASWILGIWEGGKGERRGKADGEGPSRIRASGEMWLVFPSHPGPGKPAGLLGLVPCLPEPPFSHVSPRGIGWREGRRRGEASREGPSRVGGLG